MTPRIHLASLFLALLTLTACGGGGGDTSGNPDAAAASDSTVSEAAPEPPQDPAPEAAKSMADALAGDWEGCVTHIGIPVKSSFEEIHITRISDTEFAFEDRITDTHGPDCTGELISARMERGHITLTGPVFVWDPANKRRAPAERYEVSDAADLTLLRLFSIEHDLLRFGNVEELGPDGYPRALLGSGYVRK